MSYWKTKRGQLIGRIGLFIILFAPLIILGIIDGWYGIIYMWSIILVDWNIRCIDKLNNLLK